MASDFQFLPYQIQNMKGLEQVSYPLCKEAKAFLTQMCYVKLSPKNPVLKQNLELRNLMVKRRQCHKMFDRIKCDSLQLDDRLFVVKSAYFRIDCSLLMQKNTINSVFRTLEEHLQTCAARRTPDTQSVALEQSEVR